MTTSSVMSVWRIKSGCGDELRAINLGRWQVAVKCQAGECEKFGVIHLLELPSEITESSPVSSDEACDGCPVLFFLLPAVVCFTGVQKVRGPFAYTGDTCCL